MKQWFYNKTSDVDHDLSLKQRKLLKSHESLIDENVRSKRWNDRRTNMIEELERRHALEKKQLLASLDEEEVALESALPEARRLMAQASQKLKSSYAEARAFCKAEAAHLAQKTLRTIAKREALDYRLETISLTSLLDHRRKATIILVAIIRPIMMARMTLGQERR